MKLPFDLGVKLFFRLLLPGFILALGLLPGLFAGLDAVGLEQWKEVGFVVSVLLWGWMMIGADMPIYMLLEGRRYWPKKIWDSSFQSEERRLDELNRRIDKFFSEPDRSEQIEREYLEASVEKRNFPMGKDGVPHAEYPTRLGNTITAFEKYSNSRYGIEAVFYWPRIWVNLDKDLREEIDGQQAMADSAVYGTVAAAGSSVCWSVYGTLLLVAPAAVDPLSRYLPTSLGCWAIVAGFILLTILAYQMAVFTNSQYGVIFMAVIDTHATKVKTYVDVAGVVQRVKSAAGDRLENDDDGYDTTRRYLQYYNLKLRGTARAKPFLQVAKINNAQPISNTAPAAPEPAPSAHVPGPTPPKPGRV